MSDYLEALKTVEAESPNGALLDIMARNLFRYKQSDLIPGGIQATYNVNIPGHYLEDAYTEEEKSDSAESMRERVAFVVDTLVPEYLRKRKLSSVEGFVNYGDLAADVFTSYVMSYLHGELSQYLQPFRPEEEREPGETIIESQDGECFVELLHFILPRTLADVNKPLSRETHSGDFVVVAGRWMKDPRTNTLRRQVYQSFGAEIEALTRGS